MRYYELPKGVVASPKHVAVFTKNDELTQLTHLETNRDGKPDRVVDIYTMWNRGSDGWEVVDLDGETLWNTMPCDYDICWGALLNKATEINELNDMSA